MEQRAYLQQQQMQERQGQTSRMVQQQILQAPVLQQLGQHLQGTCWWGTGER